MRSALLGLLFVGVASFAAEAPVTLESRTQLHSISVNVKAPGVYEIRIVNLKSNETIFTKELTGLPAEATGDLRDLHVSVRIGPAPWGITTTAEIEQGDTLIDSIHSVWNLTPHRARLRAPGAMRIGGDVRPPVVTRRIEPVYTDEGRRARTSGVVILEALVDKTGTVKDAVVLRGLPDGLSESAVAALKQWQFQPATLNGEPVDVIMNLTINFQIDRRE